MAKRKPKPLRPIEKVGRWGSETTVKMPGDWVFNHRTQEYEQIPPLAA